MPAELLRKPLEGERKRWLGTALERRKGGYPGRGPGGENLGDGPVYAKREWGGAKEPIGREQAKRWNVERQFAFRGSGVFAKKEEKTKSRDARGKGKDYYNLSEKKQKEEEERLPPTMAKEK